MEALKKKWNSRRGASILLALLFLLVCMMAGASVLMAAASNAGKLRSNREEQQKYLTISSALTLLCDELEGVEYVGQYYYTRVLVDEWELIGYDEETGAAEWAWEYHHDRHCYAQAAGTLRVPADPGFAPSDWKLKEVLPLFQNLDAMFAEEFVPPSPKWIPIDDYNPEDFKALSPLTDIAAVHTVTLSVQGGGTYGGLEEEVTVKAGINEEGEITLTATLGEFSMEAVLVPDSKPEDVLVLAKKPAEVVHGVHQQGRTSLLTIDLDAGKLNETAPLTWTLDRIVKKGAGG